jgi:hypothetical protein
MKFKVRDLGPVAGRMITDSGLILGLTSAAGGSANDVVLRPDGTLVHLPAGLGRALDINDAGVVLCRDGALGPTVWLFDSVTSTTEAFSMPGFRYVWPEKINKNGDVVGSVAKLPDAGDRRGFIRVRQSGSIVWVGPNIGAMPAGAVAFLYLNAINDAGHAVGTQGWTSGSSRSEAPVFYDGVVHQIGNAAYSAEGDLITSNDRMRVGFTLQGSSDTRAIYDRATNTILPFTAGWIVDYTASGMMLSSEAGDYFLRLGGAPHSLGSSMTGWSNTYPKSLNSAALIVGHGAFEGAIHGFLLEGDTSSALRVPDLAGRILWGIINDAGGVELVGGVLHRVPPHAPLESILEALPRDLGTELAAIVHDHPPAGVVNQQTFSNRASAAVARYRRNQLHRSADER